VNEICRLNLFVEELGFNAIKSLSDQFSVVESFIEMHSVTVLGISVHL